MKTYNRHLVNISLAMVFGMVGAMSVSSTTYAAAVAQRGTASTATATANRVTADRGGASVAAAKKTVATNTATATATAAATATVEPAKTSAAKATATKTAEPLVLEDKSAQFDALLENSSSSANKTSSNQLSDMIRQQRAALDAQAELAAAAAVTASGQNACDGGLRKCMQETCGKDYTKCSGDTDTTWGTKMDKCRRDVTCTGEEYRMFAAEIKADRDINAQLSSFQAIVDCGNQYNNCIVTECGKTFGKCLGKSAGDSAISKCEKIAKNCTQQDSGLAARVMEVFGDMRLDAEKQVSRDEKRLTEILDKMENQCSALGAMLDRRSLDCVYTVNFFVGTYDHPYASKKAYAGSSFDCTQDWFGVNATVFKENAYRLTRDQQSATSAMLGAGAGMAVGAVTSGAINRAIDTTKAKKALDKGEEELEALKKDSKTDSSSDQAKSEKTSLKDKIAEKKEERKDKQAERIEKQMDRKEQQRQKQQARSDAKIQKYQQGTK